MKVAIVHDYLHEYGGAETLVNAVWEIFPSADIYSATYDPAVMKRVGAFQRAKIFYPKWKDNIPGSIKNFVHKVLIANLPFYFQNLNLEKYDLVISSSAHFAKGVVTRPDQLHISYIHTPPRFLYGYQGETRKRDLWYWRMILNPLDAFLRKMDYKFAQRPDFLLCNSETVRKRIKKFYNRDAKVIYPFPEVGGNPEIRVAPKSGLPRNQGYPSFYLVVSRLAAYKNIDLIIKTCGKNNIPLKVAGTGSSREYLEALASKYKSVQMLGLVTQEEKYELYRKCRAMICAVRDEDFGMAPLEPMMFGKPVVALKESGYLETVIDGKTGIFFEELTEESLLHAIKKLERTSFNENFIKSHVQKFSRDRFKREFKEFVDQKLRSKYE
ncbi:hypothetical protein A2982_01460 [candidate division WWE3 bacterium RIFCSPLOWO2_01_FULL_39_13]|uniref:Glycosyl transferase family 1 domain-containing protein n=1 Tax=candidate division WWE3 bacterium RIFCSPLOWO2_01_FULL_39_13 TaxID=1802624 RepID=A0A1F4V4V0_UNCKA|nr:MAG: hypothetical protein A2982_01460 [candidate division WWE3 bacterium RIFCSPLOWO2_01_FULL_39_13]